MIKLKPGSYEPKKLTKFLPVQQEQLNYDLKCKAAELFLDHYGCNLRISLKEQHLINQFRVVDLDLNNSSISINCIIRPSWTKTGRWQYQTNYSLHLFANKMGMQSTFTCVFNALLNTVLVIPLTVIEKSPVFEKTFFDNEKQTEVSDIFRDINFSLYKEEIKLFLKSSELSPWVPVTLLS